jgi:hypothetical protein
MVRGVDLDPLAVLLADANARVHGLDPAHCGVTQADASAGRDSRDECWHIDPDRRPRGQRTTQLEWGEPSLDAIERLLNDCPHAAIKLAPAAEVSREWQMAVELEWIGSRGECRQQVAWFGKLARHAGMRSATIALGNGAVRTVNGVAQESVSLAGRLGRYVYEPHAAVLAADLAGALCQEHSLASISAGIAYLTGDRPVEDIALDVFEIQDVLPLDRKQLRTYCRQRRIGRLEVKKRGLDVDPEQLRKDVIGDGDEKATHILSPVLGSLRAIVARRLAH